MLGRTKEMNARKSNKKLEHKRPYINLKGAILPVETYPLSMPNVYAVRP